MYGVSVKYIGPVKGTIVTHVVLGRDDIVEQATRTMLRIWGLSTPKESNCSQSHKSLAHAKFVVIACCRIASQFLHYFPF